MTLNNVAQKDSFAVSTMKEITTVTQGARWFTVIDLKEAYHYIENKEDYKWQPALEFIKQIYGSNGHGFEFLKK